MLLDVGSELIPQRPMLTFGMIVLGKICNIRLHYVTTILSIQCNKKRMRYVAVLMQSHSLTFIQVGAPHAQ